MTRRFWITALAVLLLDQWTKYQVLQRLPILHDSREVVPGVLHITHVQNPGIAFGLFRERGIVLILLALVATAGIVWYWSHLRQRAPRPSWWLTLGLALPLGGAMGNLFDRVRIGRVVDFIDLGWWPVFNVADTAITIGAVLFACYCVISRESLPKTTVEPPPTSLA